MRKTLAIAPFLAVLLALSASAASAADRDATRAADLDAARDHFVKGTRAYELGLYEEAIAEYMAAYKIKDDPALLFNIGQAHRLAGHPAEALRFYKTYLAKLPAAHNRGEVEAKMADLTAQLGSKKDKSLEPAANGVPATAAGPPPAAGSGASAAPPPAIPSGPSPGSNPGVPGGAAAPALGPSRTAAAAQPGLVTSELEPGAPAKTNQAGEPGLPAGIAARASLAPDVGRAERIAGMVSAAGGLAVLGTGIAFGLAARHDGNELTQLDQQHGTFVPAEQTAGKRDDIVAAVLVGTGAAALVTGTVLYLLGARARTGLPSRLALLPSVGRDGGAATLGVGF